MMGRKGMKSGERQLSDLLAAGPLLESLQRHNASKFQRIRLKMGIDESFYELAKRGRPYAV